MRDAPSAVMSAPDRPAAFAPRAAIWALDSAAMSLEGKAAIALELSTPTPEPSIETAAREKPAAFEPRAASWAVPSAPAAEGDRAAICSEPRLATSEAGSTARALLARKPTAVPRLCACIGLSAATAPGVSRLSARLPSAFTRVPSATMSAEEMPAAFDPSVASWFAVSTLKSALGRLATWSELNAATASAARLAMAVLASADTLVPIASTWSDERAARSVAGRLASARVPRLAARLASARMSAVVRPAAFVPSAAICGALKLATRSLASAAMAPEASVPASPGARCIRVVMASVPSARTASPESPAKASVDRAAKAVGDNWVMLVPRAPSDADPSPAALLPSAATCVALMRANCPGGRAAMVDEARVAMPVPRAMRLRPRISVSAGGRLASAVEDSAASDCEAARSAVICAVESPAAFVPSAAIWVLEKLAISPVVKLPICTELSAPSTAGGNAAACAGVSPARAATGSAVSASLASAARLPPRLAICTAVMPPMALAPICARARGESAARRVPNVATSSAESPAALEPRAASCVVSSHDRVVAGRAAIWFEVSAPMPALPRAARVGPAMMLTRVPRATT